ADALVSTKDTLYCFEFKLRGKQGKKPRRKKKTEQNVEKEETLALTPKEVAAAVQEALEQIDTKGYLIPYTVSGKKLFKVGAVFDAKTRTLGGWKVLEE
ncbi:MAG: PD-(D/E)XK nuclease domain-containing protein, partial [Treponema sp.]|nr:PD-(D/E)XK nuclease domain-containing protein [Treponema sp.]